MSGKSGKRVANRVAKTVAKRCLEEAVAKKCLEVRKLGVLSAADITLLNAGV